MDCSTELLSEAIGTPYGDPFARAVAVSLIEKRRALVQRAACVGRAQIGERIPYRKWIVFHSDNNNEK